MRTLASSAALLLSIALAQNAIAQEANLLTADNLDPINVKAEADTFKGKDAVRLTGTRQQDAPDMRRGGQASGRRGQAAGGGQRRGQAGAGGRRGARGPRPESLAIIKGTDFNNGTIEVEVAGMPNAAAGVNARGFIGLAFHVEKSDPVAYDCFYLRPTNGRADDQLRRNHSVQYMSHPEFPFNILRRETPGVYESYADLAPGEWMKMKIEVDGEKARLYVNDAEQPCLIVNDLKRAGKGGAIALWMEQSTDGRFRNLVVRSSD